MKIVGITGNTGSGKSTFCQIMSNTGPCRIIDADKEAHQLYETHPELLDEIAFAFGSHLVIEGELQRKELGLIVFSDKEKLKKLNSIVHPTLKRHLINLIQQPNSDIEILLLDAALILELNLEKQIHFLILIDSDESIRLERLIDRGIQPDDAHNRIQAQRKMDEKKEAVDFLIFNNGTREELSEEAERIWEILAHL